MRIWYLFLLAVTIFGVVLVLVGYNAILEGENTQWGFELTMYGTIALSFVIAVVALYLTRWRDKWWKQ